MTAYNVAKLKPRLITNNARVGDVGLDFDVKLSVRACYQLYRRRCSVVRYLDLLRFHCCQHSTVELTQCSGAYYEVRKHTLLLSRSLCEFLSCA